MNKHAVIRWTVSAVAAALVVGGATACNSDADSASADSSTPPVVTVTRSSPPTSSETVSVPKTVAPIATAEPTEQESAPITQAPTSQNPAPNPTADYLGYWQGHGRQLTVNPDGTATVVLADGAANVETWSATWAAAGDGIEVTLQTMTKRYGPPLGYAAGRVLTGSIQPSAEDGVTVLHMPDFGDWCSARYGTSRTCGA